MTEYAGGEVPTVVTDTAAEYDLDVNHEYVHLDDLPDPESGTVVDVRLTVYTFEDEDRRGELRTAINQLRGNYTLATGIEWPAWVADEIEDLDNELLTTLEWLLVLTEDLTADDLDYVRDVHNSMDSNGGDS